MDREYLNNTRAIGQKGEKATAELYIKLGYIVIAQNWHWSNKGEIDIVAYNKESDIIVICEVKTRKQSSVIRACEAVNGTKQKKLKRLANAFLINNKIYLKSNLRFDVAEVVFDCENLTALQVDLIENAF